jgi:RNA polymerase sigma-70 factor (ECF subfamily)
VGGGGTVGDLRGRLTAVAGRISLDMLRARKARHENYPGSWLPNPLQIVTPPCNAGWWTPS